MAQLGYWTERSGAGEYCPCRSCARGTVSCLILGKDLRGQWSHETESGTHIAMERRPLFARRSVVMVRPQRMAGSGSRAESGTRSGHGCTLLYRNRHRHPSRPTVGRVGSRSGPATSAPGSLAWRSCRSAWSLISGNSAIRWRGRSARAVSVRPDVQSPAHARRRLARLLRRDPLRDCSLMDPRRGV